MLNINTHLDKAYSMFSDWVTKAKIDFPNLSFQIKELTNLKYDLEKSIINALESLDKKESSIYDYGYFCGFIAGNLNTIWHNEYIFKQSNNYKIFIALTATESLLQADELLKIKLSALFMEYYETQINVENVNSNIEIDNFMRINSINIKNSSHPNLAALENLKIEIIKKMYTTDIPDYLKNLNEYFQEKEVEEIIKRL